MNVLLAIDCAVSTMMMIIMMLVVMMMVMFMMRMIVKLMMMSTNVADLLGEVLRSQQLVQRAMKLHHGSGGG